MDLTAVRAGAWTTGVAVLRRRRFRAVVARRVDGQCEQLGCTHRHRSRAAAGDCAATLAAELNAQGDT